MHSKSIIKFFIIFMIKSIKCEETFNKTACSFYSDQYSAITTTNFDNFNGTRIIKNFNSFYELHFNCPTKLYSNNLIFLPLSDLLLDSTLDFSQAFGSLIFYKENNNAFFYKIKGFNNIKANRTTIEPPININIVLFEKSRLDFYVHNKLIDESNCKRSHFGSGINFFGAFQRISFDNSMVYSNKICPYVFMNTLLEKVSFGYISNSLLIKNQLRFIQINELDYFSLNNQYLNTVNFDMVYTKLTLEMMNKFVFKYVSSLIINGILDEIQTDMFSHFKFLRSINLYLRDFEKFFQKGTKWITYLNKDVKIEWDQVDLIKINLQKVITLQFFDSPELPVQNFGKIYEYPDKDICLFKDFPQNQLIFTQIIPGKRIRCTCTVLWLFKYLKNNEAREFLDSVYYLFPADFKNTNNLKCNFELKHQYNLCNFTEKFAKCSNFTAQSSIFLYSFSFDNYLDALFFFKWIELIIFVFVEPALCILGIITNFLTIIVIKNKDKIDMKDKMHKHIYINAVFNLIYCILILFKLINVCIFDSTPFCSSIYQHESAQYFKLIGIYFVGNILQLMCNYSYISFSLSRLILSTNANKSNKYLQKFDKMDLRLYYVILFLFFLLISVFKIFEYKINEAYNNSKSFPFELYDVNMCNASDFNCEIFRTFKLINDFIKDIIFFVVNFFIDFFLVQSSKEHLENKIKLMHSKKNIIAAKKANKNLNKMIITICTLFLLSHLPEFSTNILLIAFSNKLFNFCVNFISCYKIYEIAQVFNFISIDLQFFIYIRFNKNFRESYKHLKEKLLGKIVNETQKKSVIKKSNLVKH